MLALLGLSYVILKFFEPSDEFVEECNQISSKYRVLRVWIYINVIISFIIIPVYILEFFYARSLRSQEIE